MAYFNELPCCGSNWLTETGLWLYAVLQGALSPAEVRACNDTLDSIPWNPEEPDGMQPGEWWGGVQSHNYGAGGFWKDGVNLQQIYESGPAFEAFIDHPSWFEKIKTFVGSEGSFDSVWGPVFIDENLANFRGPGEAIGIHSGGKNLARNSYHYQSGRFMAMQVNVLVALTDIGPGDGACPTCRVLPAPSVPILVAQSWLPSLSVLRCSSSDCGMTM